MKLLYLLSAWTEKVDCGDHRMFTLYTGVQCCQITGEPFFLVGDTVQGHWQRRVQKAH